MYRRVNAALGDRLGGYERDYQPAVRWPFVQGVLPRSASGRITLPPEHVGWVREQAQTTRDRLRAGGATVHGDLDALVPAPDAGRALPELDEAAVARAAIETLANLAAFAHRRDQRRRRAGGATTPSPTTPPTRGAALTRGRRLAARAARRLGLRR